MTLRQPLLPLILILVTMLSMFATSLAYAAMPVALMGSTATATQAALDAASASDGGGSWGIFNLLMLIGSLSLLLFGMQRMSDGLQQAAGKRLRHLMGSITSNPFKGILAGLGVTALVQSSSITTVMVVSFVNAGVLSLKQAASVVLGANIGTTLTAWIVDTFGFKVDIAPYTLIIIAVGFPLLFFRSARVKGWGNAILGFAFLFMGLVFLKDSLPTPSPDSPFIQFFLTLSDLPYLGNILAVLLGAALTVATQSSSASTALTMAFTASGVIPFPIAACMVLGENVGTTITAEIAASVGNIYARRTARFHALFNAIGVTWALLLLPWMLKLVSIITVAISGGDPMLDSNSYGSTGLAVLHTLFNVTNVLLFVGFIPQLIKLVERLTPLKEGETEQYHLEYIGSSRELVPDLSVLEVKKELAKFGRLTSRMSKFTYELLMTDSRRTRHELLDRIKKYEEITDRVEVEIANFLSEVSSQNVGTELSIRFHGMNRVASNLERIGDIFYQVSKMLEEKEEQDITFSAQQTQRLGEMFALIDEAFEVMKVNQTLSFADVTIDEAADVEARINQKRDDIRREYYENVQENRSDHLEGDLLYNNIYHSLERIGDHIINVTEGVLGKV